MRTIKGTMSLSIGYSTAKQEDEYEIEVEDDATENDVEEILKEYWEEWIPNFIDGGWEIESDEIIKE